MKRSYLKATRGAGSRAAAEEGSALVEFAFSFMIYAIMTLGIMELALCLYTYNFVSESAREATRYASVRGSACKGFSDCNITQTQLGTFVQNLGYPGIDPNALSLTATWAGAFTTLNSPGNTVTVKVKYQFPMAVPFLFKNTWTLTSTSQMVISQ